MSAMNDDNSRNRLPPAVDAAFAAFDDAKGNRHVHAAARNPAWFAPVSVLAAGRDGIHAADVESVRRADPGIRAAGDRGPGGFAVRRGPGGLPFPNPAAMFATLDPAEIERKIGELRVIEGWLQMSLNMMQMSIKTMELQKASLEALRAPPAPARPASNRKKP